MNIIRASKGLSLNDCYWVVEEGFEGDFEKYNLPPERLRVIEKYVQQRVQLLLETMQLPDDEQEL